MPRNTGIYGRKRTQRLSKWPTLLLTLFACLGCWTFTWLASADYPRQSAPATPLWDWMSHFLPAGWPAYILGAFLSGCMAGLVQRANYYLIIIQERTMLPFLLFLLLNSTNFGFIPLRPVSIAFFFLVLCMLELFIASQHTLDTGKAYKAMFYLGIGSLVWVHLLWFIPLFWYGMYQFRLLTFRSFMASFLGIFTVYWIVLGGCVWQHDFSMFTVSFQNLIDIDFTSIPEFLQIRRLVSPLAALLTILILDLALRFNEFNVEQRTRRFASFLLACGKYTLPFLFLFNADSADFLCVFYTPASLLIAYLFSNATRKHAALRYYFILFSALALWSIHYV